MPKNKSSKNPSAPTHSEGVVGGSVEQVSIDVLRERAAAAEAFAVKASGADDSEAPALLWYKNPSGKGLLSWKQKARHDADITALALKQALAAQPKPEAAEAAEASVESSSDEECSTDEFGRPMGWSKPESAAERAARVAQHAAEGRDQWGVLLPSVAQAELSQPQPWWFFPQSPPPKYSDEECQQMVDLWGPIQGAQIILVRNEGWTMDDCCGAEMEAAWAEFCYANRVMAEDLRAKAEARIAERWRQAVVDQAQVEARRNLRRGEVVQKNGRICTRCYSCAGNKQTSWEDGGQRARPTTLHVSSECFTHAEFVAGRIRDDCPFLHQGDEGWHREWDRNFLWDPSAPTVTPLARRVCATQDSRLFCISEKSAGYLPVHLGGRPDGPDARTWTRGGGGGGGGPRGGGGGGGGGLRGGGGGGGRW